MKGHQLRKLLTDRGIDLDRKESMEKVAKQLGVQPTTLKQNLKKNIEVAKSIEERALEYEEEVHESARDQIRLKHNAHLKDLVLSIFHESLPNVSLKSSNFDFCPKFLPERPQSESTTDHNIPEFKWDTFKNEFINRINNRNAPSETVLLGKPGSGKTTVMKRLLLTLEEDCESWTPIFIPTTIYDQQQLTSLVHAAEVYYEEYLGYNHEISLEKFLSIEQKKQRLIIFIDSLDEATVEQRYKIIDHIKECPVSTILSSRYCEPAIDGSERFTENVFHLGGLSFSAAIAYLKLIISELNKKYPGDTTEHPDSTVLKELMFNYQQIDKAYKSYIEAKESPQEGLTFSEIQHSEHLVFTSLENKIFPNNTNENTTFDENGPANFESIAPAINVYGSQYPTHQDAINQQTNNSKERISLLSTPIYLNLYISLCLQRGPADVSADRLVESYINMLLGQWSRARGVFGSRTPLVENIDEKTIIDALSVLAFYSILNEHTDGNFLTKSKAEDLLLNHLSLINLSGLSEPEIKNLVNQILDAALKHQVLIQTNEGNTAEKKWLKFCSPHELFCKYFAALHTSKARDALRSKSIKNLPKSNGELSLYKYASYEQFLINPNLRFLEDTMVLFLQYESNRRSSSTLAINDYIENAYFTPSIDKDYSGYNSEEINEVIPANLILLGRFFSSPDLQSKYGSMFQKVRNDIKRLYLNTDYELLFQALSPIYHQLSKKYENEVKDQTTPFERLDKKWRNASSCQELLEIAEEAKNIKVESGNERNTDENRKIILRRIAYMMRHFASTFSEKALDWMDDQFNWNKEHDQNRTYLIVNSLKMIYDHFEDQDSKLYRNLSYWISDHGSARESQDLFKSTLNATLAKKRANETYTRCILDNPDIRVKDLVFFPAEVAYKFRRINENYERSVQDLFETLLSLQSKRKELERSFPNEPEGDAWRQTLDSEARVLQLMMYLSDSFIGQQYFLPEQYSLSEAGISYPEVSYDRAELLRTLFDGTKRNNDASYSIGGWQLYDMYIKCIWSIMRYIPSESHYNYLS